MQRIGTGKRAGFAALASALALGALSGCGSEPSRSVPVECKEAATAVERALAAAPGDVRLGGVRLSDCFAVGSDSADGQSLGLTFLPVVERLAAQVRPRPGGRAALRLGFLMGAIRKGAAHGRVYAELERRIEGELSGVDTAAPAFRRGERAGRDHG